MNVIPGEPVPPGFEDEVNRQAQIQASIDQYKGNALIGIEYTIELHEDERHEPGYLCTLCDKRGDPRTIMNHWCSFNHRMKYLEKHYPSAVRECQPVKYKPNSHNIMILIVQSLAEAIEDHYGRLQVSVMNADEFRKRKTAITEQVMKKQHFDEKSGPNFLNAIDRTLWEQKVTTKKDANVLIKAPKRLNINPAATGNGKAKLTVKDGLDEISSDDDNQDSAKKQKISRGQEIDLLSKKSAAETEKKLPTPKELSLQASHIAQERYKWEKYRCMLEIQLKQMEKIQADYEKSPEKHPHYPEEWKKFWNRRYKELQAEKKVDPNKYDYKPEWIIFWTKRMKDLFNAEVDKKKKEIKVKLGLPEDAEEKVDQLKEKYKVPVNRFSSSNKPTSSRGGQPLDVIDISDDDSPRHSRYPRSRRSRSRSRSPRERGRPRDYRRSRSRSRTRSRSLSPFSDEFDLNSSSKHHVHKKLHNPIRHYNIEHPAEYYPYSRPSRYPPPSAIPPHYQPAGHHYRVLDSSQIPKYQESDSRPTKESIEEPRDEEPEGPLTVVAVLRLLTALEEHLGSLGPKVVDMLGKALALEKVKGNSSDDLLTNEDHCVFFETIKEKLKGLLIADVLEDQQKVKAVKRAIKNIAAIIHQVTTKGPQTETTNKDKDDVNADGLSKTKKSPNKNSTGRLSLKDLPFDRQTVATKMAAALVMQGREDVSTADMDKLIYMFILMVKLSKPKREDDGKPLYCNDILPQLGIARNMSKTTSLSLANLPAIVDDLLENEVNALVQEVEDEMENEARENDKESKNDGNSSMLESLTDSDLQTLLQNFKHLSSEEQHHLIAHLKKLESADPSRVEKLRKFVNISDLTGSKEHSSKSSKTSDSTPTKSSTRSKSRFDDSPPSGSKKSRTAAPPGTEDDGDDDNSRRRVNPNKFSLDDDEDDDYNFEDVFKAASSNVNRLSEEHSRQSERNTKSPIVPVSSSPSALTFNPAGLKTSLNDTQNLIANIMGSLQQSNSNSATKSSTSATSATKHIPKTVSSRAAPQPVPPIAAAQLQQQQMPPQQQPHQMAFYQQQQQQQQQQQGYPGPYNQMNAAQANYYNSMGGYNQTPYDGYQQWGHGPQPQMPPQNMQQFGVQGYGMPPQQMGYNMYGQGHN